MEFKISRPISGGGQDRYGLTILSPATNGHKVPAKIRRADSDSGVGDLLADFLLESPVGFRLE